MMTVRYTGILLLFACGVAGAYIVKSNFKRSLEAEEELLSLIELIRNKITYFREPIKDIYASYECSALSETGFIDEAYENGWSSGIGLLKRKRVISAGFADAVEGFGGKLGSSMTEDEINNCSFYAARALEVIEKDKTALPNRSKLYSSFCIAGALLTAILLF